VEVAKMGVFVCPPGFPFSQFNLPNRPTVGIMAAALLVLVHAGRVDAQVVVNELYYDHPGSDDGYEFVELMNVSDASVSLAAVSIQFHNGAGEGWEVLWAGADGEIGPGALYAVGGRHVSPAPDDVAGFSLQNGPDALRVTVGGVQTDLVAYGSLEDAAYVEGRSAPGVSPGRSLARIPDGEDSDDNEADFTEVVPSPGSFNVARYDAGLVVAGETLCSAVLSLDGIETIELSVVNNGMYDISVGGVSVEMWDSTGSPPVHLSRTFNEERMSPGAVTTFAIGVVLSPGYHWLLARIDYAADERSFNDQLVLLRRVGGPTLLVSEILCYPRDDCPQFVELFNAGLGAVDIDGFKLRDRSHDFTTVTTVDFAVPPGGYVVVTPDAAALCRYFPAAPCGSVVEHEGTWPTLNRTGSAGVSDSVVLADALELPVDAVGYPPIDSDYKGRSLERVDLFEGRTSQTWVLSEDPAGASPGRRNRRSLFAPPAPGSMEVWPRTFSPFSGETMTVAIDAEPGIRVVVGVYDVEGRRLAELGSATAFPAVFVWDGRDATGRRLVPGLYILACESYAETGERVATRKLVVGCGRRGG
jgi:hypothetical protein